VINEFSEKLKIAESNLTEIKDKKRQAAEDLEV